MKVDKSLSTGSTAMLLLQLLEKEDLYGYQMIERLEQKSNHVFTLKAGTLYPLLHSLEQKNSVESYEVEQENGRIRKYYKITNEGHTVLQYKKREWEMFTSAVNKVMGDVCIAPAY